MKKDIFPKIKYGLFVLIVLTISFTLIGSNQNHQKDGYEITIHFKPYKNCSVTLGHYFGEVLSMDTTAWVNKNGTAIFSGDSKLHSGIYTIHIDGKEGYSDFLVGDDQHFEMTLEFEDNTHAHRPKQRFKNSVDNELMLAYKTFMSSKEEDIYHKRTMLADATNSTDSFSYVRQLSNIDREIQEYRADLIKKNPESFLSTLLIAMQEPLLPDHLRYPSNKADSLAGKNYIKAHYWDGVKFWDGRLTYSPFFNLKLDKYFSEIIGIEADTVIQKIDWMMSSAIANENMTKVILGKLLYGSMVHEYKWDASVYIHLYENYIASNDQSWLTPTLRKTITDHAYLLMGTTKGAPSGPINLLGEDGTNKSLHDVQGKYTLLCFWDLDCDHCVKTIPVLDSMYNATWKEEGIELYTVSVETVKSRAEWKEFIQLNKLQNLTNVYLSMEEERKLKEQGDLPILQQYDVWYYPSFFLLDNEKNFLAKKLTYQQMIELIDSLMEKEEVQIN